MEHDVVAEEGGAVAVVTAVDVPSAAAAWYVNDLRPRAVGADRGRGGVRVGMGVRGFAVIVIPRLVSRPLPLPSTSDAALSVLGLALSLATLLTLRERVVVIAGVAGRQVLFLLLCPYVVVLPVLLVVLVSPHIPTTSPTGQSIPLPHTENGVERVQHTQEALPTGLWVLHHQQ